MNRRKQNRPKRMTCFDCIDECSCAGGEAKSDRNRLDCTDDHFATTCPSVEKSQMEGNDDGRENDQEVDRCSSGRTEDMEMSNETSDQTHAGRQREDPDKIDVNRMSGVFVKKEDSLLYSIPSATTSNYFQHKLHLSDSKSKKANFHVHKIIKPDPDDAETTTSEYASEGNYLDKDDNHTPIRSDQKFDYFSNNFAETAFVNSSIGSKHVDDGATKTGRISSVESFSPSYQGKSALAKLSEMFSGKTRDLSFKSYGEKLLENQSSKVRKMEHYFPFSTFSLDDKQVEAKSFMSATSTSSVVDPDMLPIKYEGNFDGQNCVRKLESLVASMNKRTKLNTTRQSELTRLSSSGKDHLQHAYATNYQANQNKSHNYLFPFSVEALTSGYPNEIPLDLTVRKKKRNDSRGVNSPSTEQSSSMLSTSFPYKMPSLYINDHTSNAGSSLASLEKKFGENSKILDWVGTTTRTTNIFSNFSDTTSVEKPSSAYSSLCGMMLNDFGISPPLVKTRQFVGGASDQFCMKHSPQMPRAKESQFSKPLNQSIVKEKEFRLYPVLGNWPSKQKDSVGNSNLSTTKKRCGSNVSPNSPKSSEPCKTETGFRLVRGQDAWMRSGYEQAEQILRCLECNTSFDSLPKLTVHMIQTAHYLNLARQDKYLRGSIPGESSRPDYFVPHSASFSNSSEAKGIDKDSLASDLKKSVSPKSRNSPNHSRSPFSPVKFIKQEPIGSFSRCTPEDKESLDKQDDNESTANDSYGKSVRIPHLKKVSSADSDTSNERSPTCDIKDHATLIENSSFGEENSTPPKLEPVQTSFDHNQPKNQSSSGNQNESNSALKAMQSFINRSFSGKSTGVQSFLSNNTLSSTGDKFVAGGYVQPKASTLQDEAATRRLAKRRHPTENYKSNKLRDEVSDTKKTKYNYQDIGNFYSSILRNDSITNSLMSRLSEVITTDRKDKPGVPKNSGNEVFPHWDGSMTASEAEFNGLLAARIQGMNLDSFLRSVVEHIARDGTNPNMLSSEKRSKSSSSYSSSSSSSPFDDKFTAKTRPNLPYVRVSPQIIPDRPSRSPAQSFSIEDGGPVQKSALSQNSSNFSRTSNTPSGTRSKAVVISHCLSSDVKRNEDSDEDVRKPVPETLILVNPIITVMSKDSSHVSSPPTDSKKFGDADPKLMEPQVDNSSHKSEMHCESPRFGFKKGSPSNGGSQPFPATSSRHGDFKNSKGKHTKHEFGGQNKDHDLKKMREDFKCRNCSKTFVSRNQYKIHMDDCPEGSWSSKITSSVNTMVHHKSLFSSVSSTPTCSSLSKKTPLVEDSHANRFLKYYQLANELSGKSNC